MINFDKIVDSIPSWHTVSISSTVLCINNVFLLVQTNWIIELIQLSFQLMISVLTIILVVIKIIKELKNKKSDEAN